MYDVIALVWNDEKFWRALRRLKSKCSLFGLQYEPRNGKTPDRNQVDWTGFIMHIRGHITGILSNENWEETKMIILEENRMKNYHLDKIP